MTSTFRGPRTCAVLVAAVLLSLVLATTPPADAAATGPRIDSRLTTQLSKLSLGDKLGAFVHFDGGSAVQSGLWFEPLDSVSSQISRASMRSSQPAPAMQSRDCSTSLR